MCEGWGGGWRKVCEGGGGGEKTELHMSHAWY